MKLNLSQFDDLANSIQYYNDQLSYPYQPQHQYSNDELANTIHYYQNQFNTTNMNMDNAYNILLQTDYTALPHLCSSNQLFNRICHQPHFWQDKYDHDGLLRFKDKVDKHEYKKVYSITNKIDEIFNNLKNATLQGGIPRLTIIFNNNENIIPFLPINQDIKPRGLQQIGMQYGDLIRFNFMSINVKSVNLISIDQAKEILIRIKYYYPNVQVVWM